MYADFLVIDDIGAENCTEWNRDVILMPLLNHRYEEGLATWFSSNCDIPSLQRHFTFSANNREDVLKAERIIERIRHMAKAVALTGRDGGRCKARADVCIIVPEKETFKIQERHLPIYHALCAMVEATLFEPRSC